ncbi:glycosyl transferase [Chlorella sorokiniana]|uniref:Glycosyl transferase n=1 Tax=Chlorella sorokiniana TaxID=3076 RepID=A0A2P6U3Z9_CHLSO|nr:glycosyl transferase [Chlorella sorokiniana]|eukprot:PRW61047.1 glycosyl transferase [Chlorella sorokiniana]
MGAVILAAAESPTVGRRRRRINVLRSIVILAACIVAVARLPRLQVPTQLSLYQQQIVTLALSGSSSAGSSSSSSSSRREGSIRTRTSGGSEGGDSSSGSRTGSVKDGGSSNDSGSGSTGAVPSTQSAGEEQSEESPPSLQLQAELPPDFRFNRVVAIVAYDRFEYFRQVIDALRRAWGSEEYTVVIAIDGPPKDEQQQQHFNRQGWADTVAYSEQLAWLAERGQGFAAVHVNTSAANLGLWANKKRAVAAAFQLSDFVVVLEDDVTLERDALRWFEWHITSGLAFTRPELALATCWSASFPYWPAAVEGRDALAVRELGLLDKYWSDQWAVPWGWATWRRTWDAVGANWTGQDADLGQAVLSRGWRENIPLVARCNNIGSVGTHRAGQVDQHIHQRALTSGSFRGLATCQYRELQRANTSQHTTFEPLYAMVRQGIEGDARATAWSGKGMGEYREALRAWVAAQPDPSLYHSSC